MSSDQRIALITGGNRGIGLAIVEQLAERGIRVYLGSRNFGQGWTAAEKLKSRHLDVRPLSLDVTDGDSVASAVEVIAQDSGHLDILINNAAVSGSGALPSETAVEDLIRTFDTNVFGVVRVTNAMLPLIRQSQRGRIINISSDLGSLQHLVEDNHPMGPFPLLLDYNSSKTALNAITIAYAKELLSAKILVNAVSPGYVSTELNSHNGTMSTAEGAASAVKTALIDDDGPTGTFVASSWLGGVALKW